MNDLQPSFNGGAQQQSTYSTTPMSNLSHAHNLILEAGIPLFELHKRTGGVSGEPDLGYANCIVSDKFSRFTNRQVANTVRWFNGQNGYIKYNHVGNGLLVAFCPDDPDWYNRIRLAAAIHSAKFKIVRHHSIYGVHPEKRINDEILLISRYVHDWKVKKNKEVIFRSRYLEEAEDFVRKQRSEGQEVSEPLFGKIAAIEKLITIHKSYWIYSNEFQQEMKPAMIEKINQKFGTPDKSAGSIPIEEIQSLIQTNVQTAISSMTEEQLENILNAKRRAAGKVETEEKPKFSGIKDQKGNPIEESHIKTLQSLAANKYSIDASGKTRDELIALIEESEYNKKRDDISSVVGPVTAEENIARKAMGHDPIPTEAETVEL